MSAAAYTRTWARHLITAGTVIGPTPRYGTDAWADLADGDPRRVAAVVIAAECWRADDPDTAWACAIRDAEQAGARAAWLAHVDAAWPEVQAAGLGLARWIDRRDRSRAAGSDYAMTSEERVAHAARPRVDDHPGGPVPWDRTPLIRMDAA